MGIPLMNIQAQYAPLRDRIDAAIKEVLDTGAFILGPQVRELEKQVAELRGIPLDILADATTANAMQALPKLKALLQGIGADRS